jgi:hypothetical protein
MRAGNSAVRTLEPPRSDGVSTAGDDARDIAGASGFPQFMQKRAALSTVAPHLGQFMGNTQT